MVFDGLRCFLWSFKVRDIWTRSDLGSFSQSFNTDSIGGHDSRFYLLTPA